jgi:hypothetical protein
VKQQAFTHGWILYTLFASVVNHINYLNGVDAWTRFLGDRPEALLPAPGCVHDLPFPSSEDTA